MENSSRFSKNEVLKRFELVIEHKVAFVEYIVNNDDIMFLIHTEVPQELGGKGVGSALVLKTLEWIKENDFTLAPLCPFVATYIKRHPDWSVILNDRYKV